MAIGNLNVVTNTLSSTNTNGNIILAPNGSGLVSIASAFTLPRVDGSSGFVLKTNGSGVVSWAAETVVPFAWTVVTGNTQAITENNGYFANNATQQIIFTLPATAAVGDEFEIAALNAFAWKLDQGSGQSIIVGTSTTTTGIAGSISASETGAWIKVICSVANSGFIATIQQGNVTVA
jgi:hypothetical protein